MAEWIRNGHECSECGFRLTYSAECREMIEQCAYGYKYINYAVIPAECPRCHSEMIAVVYEGGDENG